MIRKLYQLRNGQSGFVAAIAATGERAQRFRDMGLLPGVGITVMGRSPMGDLLSLRVMGTTLALRVADAEDVTVSTDD
ncbi:FeoA domain-containing protein [uncultured Bilophila sp.]|uniref:FeoA family protein n=1 Tax=uncultured Bilophila sp. TaxID=529385 RepID=UPI00266ECFC2|nr:FeoA domain-containing protein [uncultured Bilophila sp.]